MIEGMDTTTLPTDTSQLLPQSTIDSLATVFAISTIISIVVLVLFVIMYTVNQVRRWRVDNAILEMRRDLREIKTHLATTTTEPTVTQPVAAATPPAPDRHDQAA